METGRDVTDRPFGIYEKAVKPQEWERMFADAAEAGYQNFEISLDESDARLARLHWKDSQYDQVRTAARNQNIRILSACFSGHRRFPLGSCSGETARRGIQMMKEGIDFCQNLGVRILQVAGYDAFYEPRSEATAARYRENILGCLKWAEQAGVMLAIEPVEVNLVKVSDTLRLVREADSPWLQIYPDVANMKSLGIDPVTELPQGRGHIANVHVRDSLPDYFYGVPLGTGNMDFIGVFRALDAMDYRGPLTIEMWNEQDDNYMEVITRARRFMQNKIKCARQEVQINV